MKPIRYPILLAPLFLSLAPAAWPQETPAAAEPPTLTGQLHLSITDGKGNKTDIRLPENEPMKLDLTPWKDLVEKAGGVNGLAESAAAAFESWAGDFSRRLSAHQQVKSPWIGVAVQPVPESVAAQMPSLKRAGLLVRGVSPGSPAAAAGLKADDVLVRLNEQVLFSEDQFRKLVASLDVGATAELTWMREGKESKASCALANAPASGFSEAMAAALLGPKAGEMLKTLGPDAERMVGQLLTNPKLLEQLPALQKMLTTGPDGRLDLSGLQSMLDQARQSAPELKFLLGEMVRMAQSEADLNVLAEKLKQEMDAISPEVRQRAALLMKLALDRMAKAAGK